MDGFGGLESYFSFLRAAWPRQPKIYYIQVVYLNSPLLSVDGIKKLMSLGAQAGVGPDVSHSSVGPPCLHQSQAPLQWISSLLLLHHNMTSLWQRRLYRRVSALCTALWWGALQSRGPSPVPSPFPLSARLSLETSSLQMYFWSIQASKLTHPPFRAATKPEARNTQFLTPCSSTLFSFMGKTLLMLNRPITAGSDVGQKQLTAQLEEEETRLLLHLIFPLS